MPVMRDMTSIAASITGIWVAMMRKLFAPNHESGLRHLRTTGHLKAAASSSIEHSIRDAIPWMAVR